VVAFCTIRTGHAQLEDSTPPFLNTFRVIFCNAKIKNKVIL